MSILILGICFLITGIKVVLIKVCERVNGVYPGLQARVTKTLVRALLDSSKSIQTVVGACCALAEMGREVVDLVIIPNLNVVGSRYFLVDFRYALQFII
jgi:hypothetical protein